MHRPSGLVASFALALAALTGCGGSDLVLPSDGVPAELQIRGDGQEGAVGAPLADSLEVSVLDSRGEPLAGQTVTFALESEVPRAQVTPETARTGSNGAARALWVLGATSGTQTVVATVDRGAGTEPLEARFTATVAPGAASRMEIAGGNEQSATAGSALDPIAVRVTDEFGNPVANVPVDWTAASGTVDPASSTTGDDGLASTIWTLGTGAGSQSATATSDGLSGSPVTFTAEARAGSPDELVGVSGDDQSAAPGTELPAPLVVRLVDDRGNGVPNRAVSWVVATGGGSASPATSTTDSDGRASTRWTIGAGANTLNAVVSGVGVVGFTATGTGGGGGGGGGGSTAARLEFRVQPSDTEERETMSPPVQVAVLDQSGNLVTDREFSIKLELLDDDDDKVKAEGTDNTRSGIATFTIRISKDGDYRLRASTDGLPSVESDRFKVEDD
jgi:hypothetical protein